MDAEYEPTTATGQLVFLETSPCRGLHNTGVLFRFFEFFFDFGDFLLLAGTSSSESNVCGCCATTPLSVSVSSWRLSLTVEGVISVRMASSVALIRSSSSSVGTSSATVGARRDSPRSARYQSSAPKEVENLIVYEQRPLQPLEMSSIFPSSCPLRTQQLRNHTMPLGSSCFFPHTMKLSDGLT